MSTSLQLGLAAVGGVILIGLALHNMWQQHKQRPRRAQATDDATNPTDTADSAEPTAQSTLSEADALLISQHSAPTESKRALDVLIDATAHIELDADATVTGAAAIAALPDTRYAGNKPFAVEGRNASTQAWEALQAHNQYDAFQAGVQLANRAGALNEIGFSEFALKTQGFADEVNGTPHFPDMIEEVARARELDQFASDNDARVSFVLRTRAAAWSTGYLQQIATRKGFVAGALPGRMILPSLQVDALPLLSLEFDTQAALAEDLEHAVVKEFYLSLDVPQVPSEQRPFARLCSIAQELAHDMEGTIIDGNGMRIDAVAMQSIEQDVEDMYLLLAQRDFHAGSTLARRLFS